VIDAIREFFETYLQGSWTSIIDILLVAFVIYWLFILIRGTRAVRIVIGLSILYLVYLAARLLNLQLLTQLMETAAVVGLFAVVVVFQPELRRALEQIGRIGSVNRFFVSAEVAGAERVAREISRAARILAGSSGRPGSRTSPRRRACRSTPICEPSCWPRSSTAARRSTMARSSSAVSRSLLPASSCR